MSACRACGAEIVWGRTKNNRAMPLDAEPTPDGNCLLDEFGSITVSGKPVEGGRRAHHSTCPEWKR